METYVISCRGIRLLCKRKSTLLIVGLTVSSLFLVGQVVIGKAFDYIIIPSIDESFTSGYIDKSKQETSKFVTTESLYEINKTGITVSSNSQKSPSAHSEFPRTCQETPLIEPIWEWYNFSVGTPRNTSHKKLLIAQYSAFGKYARLLELTSPINKEYAKRWNHDMVVLQGTTMIIPSYDTNCTPPEERSRFNKVSLLLKALSKSQDYDQLLILDADTIIYDFEFDITGLLSGDYMLVAQRLHEEDLPVTTNINNGVTLWNLHHPLSGVLSQDWDRACREGIPDNRPFRGDQYYLRQVLKHGDYQSAVWSVWNEFYYRDGTVIKHFQRSNARSWNETGLETREERIQNATLEICGRFGLDIGELEYVNYTNPKIGNIEESTLLESDETAEKRLDKTLRSGLNGRNATNCTLKRQSVWDMYNYSQNKTRAPEKRLLIAQYAAFGSYARLLELTSPINKAYARKWSHDFLALQGVALVLKSDGPCDLPRQRAMYNKLPILLYALNKVDEYDQLLILDADAMMYNLSFDVTKIIDDEKDILAGHRVNPFDGEYTWNINNGVTLWNLHHPMTVKVAREWFFSTVKGLNNDLSENSTAYNEDTFYLHGDQFYLHKILKRDKKLSARVRSLPIEFKYINGTVVKHFVRTKNNFWSNYGMDRREISINETVAEICERYPDDCTELDETPYTLT